MNTNDRLNILSVETQKVRELNNKLKDRIKELESDLKIKDLKIKAFEEVLYCTEHWKDFEKWFLEKLEEQKEKPLS